MTAKDFISPRSYQDICNAPHANKSPCSFSITTKSLKLSNKLLANYVIIIILLILFSITIFFGYIIFNFFNESPMIILDDNEYEIALKEKIVTTSLRERIYMAFY